MDANERRQRAGSEAADWFARLQADTMNPLERQQFVEWLRESHIHVAEMLRIAQIHGSLERFERWARISTGAKIDADNVVRLPALKEGGQSSQDPQSAPRPPPSGAPRARHTLRLFAVASAAVLIVATLIALPRVRGQIIETERGERREVVLNDGSILQVDPETRLRVKYAKTVRQVFLERGRAVFHVAKNPSRPFLVQADDTTVRAVGTAFGVEEQAQGVIVTVVEGKVAVFPTSRATSPATASDSNGAGATASAHPESHSGSESVRWASQRRATREDEASPLSPPESNVNPSARVPESPKGNPDMLLLTANQQVTVHSGSSAESVQEVDSQRALAWAEGRLIFQNDELGHTVAEFNRYNHVQLRVEDPELAVQPVSGVFNAAEPEAFVAFLQSVASVKIVRDGDRTITIGPARSQ